MTRLHNGNDADLNGLSRCEHLADALEHAHGEVVRAVVYFLLGKLIVGSQLL